MQREKVQTAAESAKEQDDEAGPDRSLPGKNDAASKAGRPGASSGQAKHQPGQPVPASGLVLFMLKNCGNK
jgi:hypothetical protein